MQFLKSGMRFFDPGKNCMREGKDGNRWDAQFQNNQNLANNLFNTASNSLGFGAKK